MNAKPSSKHNASQYLAALKEAQSEEQREKNQRFVSHSQGTEVLGVRHKQIFDLAKEYRAMPRAEIEKLLDSPYYEARMGAVSIMDYKVQPKNVAEDVRQDMYELYMDRHDRINNWDLVDRSAKRVVGGYLFELGKPRDVLLELAKSEDEWRRRTAIVATSYFIGNGELEDTFRVARVLVEDEAELIQKAVGGWIREAGKKDEAKLTEFLDEHAASMPRPMLRNAVQKLPQKLKTKYMQAKQD